jgi:hypothetical protein
MIGFISISVTLSLLITINTALSLIYTLYSSPLHTQYDCPSSLVVSWQWNSTQKLALQITMKSYYYFVFNHSVLLYPNLYSTAPPAYDWLQTTFVVLYKPARTYRKHITWSLSTVVWCHCLRGSVFTESLYRNGLHNTAILLLRARTEGCLSSRFLEMRWHVTILNISHFSKFSKWPPSAWIHIFIIFLLTMHWNKWHMEAKRI